MDSGAGVAGLKNEFYRVGQFLRSESAGASVRNRDCSNWSDSSLWMGAMHPVHLARCVGDDVRHVE